MGGRGCLAEKYDPALSCCKNKVLDDLLFEASALHHLHFLMCKKIPKTPRSRDFFQDRFWNEKLSALHESL
jgi:hypothetical protein